MALRLQIENQPQKWTITRRRIHHSYNNQSIFTYWTEIKSMQSYFYTYTWWSRFSGAILSIYWLSSRIASFSGDCNVRHSNVKRKGLKYLADIFTTLVDCPWRWCALIFALGFFSTWLIYALLYFFFSWLHDDLTRSNLDLTEWKPCINKVRLVITDRKLK